MRRESAVAPAGTTKLSCLSLLKGVPSMRSHSLSLFALLLCVPLVAGAQGRGGTPPRTPPRTPDVPPSLMPPAGKCRVWIEGVAPAQQPAPTDCQTALRTKPSNGTVVFGPQPKEREPETFESQPARGLAPARRAPSAMPESGKAPPPRDTTRPPRSRRPAAERPERP